MFGCTSIPPGAPSRRKLFTSFWHAECLEIILHGYGRVEQPLGKAARVLGIVFLRADIERLQAKTVA